VIRAITLDFGNTLVPVPDGALREVVGETARAIATRLGPFDEDEVNRVWSEERARQFREEVPLGREVDLAQRLGRILARLRGMPVPPDAVRWDDARAGLLSDAAGREIEVEAHLNRGVEFYAVRAEACKGVAIGSSTTAPFSINWVPNTLTRKSKYNLQAQAIDAAGNTGVTAIVVSR